MMWADCATLVSAVLIALVAPRLSRQMPPATATVLLVGSAIATIIGISYALGTLAFTWIAQIPAVAEEGDWSPLLLRDSNPVPAAVAILAGAVLVASNTQAVKAAFRRCVGYRRMRGSLAGLDHDNGLIVLTSSRPDAYATPAAGGRIVVTTGLLQALHPGESRAVLAHERAHLSLKHNWWIVAADLAAAANPLLRSTSQSVAESVERWADERAAAEIGDRKLVARALARAALRTHAQAGASAGLGVADGQMTRRVNALLVPPPRRRLAPVIVLVGLLAIVGATTLSVEANTDHLFDRATIAAPEHGRLHTARPAPITHVG